MWRYDRRSGNCNFSNCKVTRKNFRTSSALALQCHGFESRWSPEILGGGLRFGVQIAIITTTIIFSHKFVFPQFTSSFRWEVFVTFGVYTNQKLVYLQTIVTLAPFCIPTSSLPLLLSYYTDLATQGERQLTTAGANQSVATSAYYLFEPLIKISFSFIITGSRGYRPKHI